MAAKDRLGGWTVEACAIEWGAPMIQAGQMLGPSRPADEHTPVTASVAGPRPVCVLRRDHIGSGSEGSSFGLLTTSITS